MIPTQPTAPARPSNAEPPVPVKPGRCPVCGWVHPNTNACKPREKADNGYTLTHKTY